MILTKPYKKARILLFDLETSPNLSWVWQRYQQDVIDIKTDWYILCFAYKWLGHPTRAVKIQKPEDDKALVRKLWGLFDKADIIIAHNAVEFDIKKSNARFIIHGLPPPSPYKVIDTKKVAKKYFRFDSNKLDELGRQLGVGRKIKHQGFELWKGCMIGEKKAWQTMIKYNKQDVELLERVYLKLRPWMDTHPMTDRPEKCQKCGGRLHRRGTCYAQKRLYRDYRCITCGGHTKGEMV